MPAIVLQQVSSAFARENAGKTLEKPFALKRLLRQVESEAERERLSTKCGAEFVHAWGAKAERLHQFVKMPTNESLVLFRRHERVYGFGIIVAKLMSERAGRSLWGQGADGETWPLIFVLRKFNLVPGPLLAETVNVQMQRKPSYNWQGLNAVVVPSDERLKAFFEEQASGA